MTAGGLSAPAVPLRGRRRWPANCSSIAYRLSECAARRRGMFLFYLIDPVSRSIEKVSDGFDRAAELTNSDAPELDTLWADPSEPDSSVDVAYDPDASDQPAFRLRLSHD